MNSNIVNEAPFTKPTGVILVHKDRSPEWVELNDDKSFLAWIVFQFHITFCRILFPRVFRRIVELENLLKEVKDNGLIYWEPNTNRGHVQRSLMIKEIEDTLRNG